MSQLSRASHSKYDKSLQLAKHITDKANISTLLSRRYEQLLRSEKHYDCIFHIESTTIKCHKLILSSASPVFEAMFFGPLREQLEIEIHDITAEIFKVLIDYIYMAKVDFDQLSLESTIELFYCAEKYLLNELIADCLVAITRKLRFANILPALELSVCMNLSNLLEVCMTFFLRCCVKDPHYMAHLKRNYLHVSKECIKAIIAAASKEMEQKHLLWFVYEWCQQECNQLGLQESDCALIIDDLQLKENGILIKSDITQTQKLNSINVERNYYKACRPFTVDCDSNVWKFYLKCDRFISLLGIVMNSRLAPQLKMFATTTTQHISLPSLVIPTEYNETLRIEVSALEQNVNVTANNGSDGEDSDNDNDCGTIISYRTVTKQPTTYNCDQTIYWQDAVILSPEVEYEIKLIWSSNAYGAEYPCSLQSTEVDGIQFRDSDVDQGSIIKGIRFLNLV